MLHFSDSESSHAPRRFQSDADRLKHARVRPVGSVLSRCSLERPLVCFLGFLGLPSAAPTRADDRRLAVEDVSHLLGDAIRRHPQGFVDMDVALGYASGSMSQKRRDGQLGEAEVAGEACEGMTQRVRRDVGDLGALADAVEHADDADEMPFAPVGREEERRFGLGLSEEEFDGRLADYPGLRAALGVRETPNTRRCQIGSRRSSPASTFRQTRCSGSSQRAFSSASCVRNTARSISPAIHHKPLPRR